MELQQEYIAVKTENENSYGGNQNWYEKGLLSDYGCGLVALGDILLYMTKTERISFPSAKRLCGEGNVKKQEYLSYIKKLGRFLWWMFPLTKGVPGPLLAVWFNWICFWNKSPYKATWSVPSAKIHKAISVMLEKDIPVLFSVGANFPWIWKREGVNLYQKQSGLICTGKACRHYMTITGMKQDEVHGELLQISSWGKKYYIKWKDYEDFLRKKSCGLFTNILYITERDC